MTADGYQTPDGSGNGAPPRLNPVTVSPLWRACRDAIEQDYPWLAEHGVMERIEALMTVLDVEEDARHIGGDTWFLRTPDDYFPVVTIYFEYIAGRIILRAAHAAER